MHLGSQQNRGEGAGTPPAAPAPPSPTGPPEGARATREPSRTPHRPQGLRFTRGVARRCSSSASGKRRAARDQNHSVVKSRFAVLQILPTPTPAAPHDLRRPLISALRSRSSLLKMSRSRRLHAACGLCRLTSHYYVSYEKKYLRDVTH